MVRLSLGQQQHLDWQKRWIVALVLTGVAAMLGLVVASVPLYRWFCRANGYGGTPSIASRVPDALVGDTMAAFMTIRFDANTHNDLPWSFTPLQPQVVVRVGEPVLATYLARNNADVPITGTATFNVTPAKAGPFFNKIACFCFTEQTLAPGQSVEMPVTFFVDPKITTNPQTAELTTITLSYTFFRSPGNDINRRS